MPFPSVFGSLWTPHRAAAWTALFLFLLTASAYFCGVNAKRALQHAVFIVPFIALWLLSLPARSNESRSGWQKVCLAAAVVGLLLAFIDAALRAFLYQTYSAEPMSTFVLESAANTNLDEALGFLATEWTGALLGSVTLSRRVNCCPIRHAFGKQDVFRQRDGFRLGAVALAILDAAFCVRLYPQLGQTLLANSLSPCFLV